MDKYAHLPRNRYRLTVKEINQTKRPKLAKVIKSSRFIYALNEIPSRLKDEGQRIYVFDEGKNVAVLTRDEIIDGEEQIRSFLIPDDCLNVLANIVLQEKMQQLAELKDQADREALHHQRRGRPRKYFSQDIQQVIALQESGMSIRKIAQELKMSPTTVQKLLSMKDVIDWND